MSSTKSVGNPWQSALERASDNERKGPNKLQEIQQRTTLVSKLLGVVGRDYWLGNLATAEDIANATRREGESRVQRYYKLDKGSLRIKNPETGKKEDYHAWVTLIFWDGTINYIDEDIGMITVTFETVTRDGSKPYLAQYTTRSQRRRFSGKKHDSIWSLKEEIEEIRRSGFFDN